MPADLEAHVKDLEARLADAEARLTSQRVSSDIYQPTPPMPVNYYIEQCPPIPILSHPADIHSWILTLKQIQKSQSKGDASMVSQAICYTRGEIQRFLYNVDPDSIKNLSDLERTLKIAFCPEKSVGQKLQELVSEKQKENELVSQFYSRIVGKAKDYCKSADQNDASSLISNIFKSGLKTNIARRVMEQASPDCDNDELLELARKFETIDLTFCSPNEVLTAAVSSQNINHDMSQSRTPSMSRSTRGNYFRNDFSGRNNARIKCWNCRGPHRQSECKEPITCIRCGEIGHKSKFCLAPAPINLPQGNQKN